MAGSKEKVSIRPGVSVLSVLRHLNYRPWFALAEFIDNSIQSYLDYKTRLIEVDGDDYELSVRIEIDPSDRGRITIRDNAAGIHEKDFARAFRPAAIPQDRSGLAEFGMGMKSAACWFAPVWHVRTSALGENTEKLVIFDIARIVNDSLEELDVQVSDASVQVHFTEIVLAELYRVPIGRTLGKIREHLAEIYRVFTRRDELSLRLNGEVLTYQEPAALQAPLYDRNNEASGDPLPWRKEINFDFGQGLKAHGFAGLRAEGSTKYAGFSLFRRGRLIQGSADEKYRPYAIFGNPNDYAYQRLFGELHLEGFEVSHTKDGFRWDENEEPFLQLLREELNKPPLPLLDQADNYRARPSRNLLKVTSERVGDRTANSIKKYAPAALTQVQREPPTSSTEAELIRASTAARRTIDIDFEGRKWRVVLELSDDPSIGDWLEVSDSVVQGMKIEGRELVGLRISLVHPFMQRFSTPQGESVEPLVRIGAALGLAEKVARDGGVSLAGAIRAKFNKLLREALSRL